MGDKFTVYLLEYPRTYSIESGIIYNRKIFFNEEKLKDFIEEHKGIFYVIESSVHYNVIPIEVEDVEELTYKLKK